MSNENKFAEIDDADIPPSNALEPITPKFELTDAAMTLASQMGLSLDGDVASLIGDAAKKTNQALVLVVESGLMLLMAQEKIDSERSESTFKEHLLSVGMPEQRAYEAMSMAKYVARLPNDQRQEIMLMPKTKVMLLAQADPEVVTDLFEDESADIQALSVRELKQTIRDLKAKNAQSSVERQKAVAENEKLQRQLKEATKSRADVTDIVPAHVSDIRIETAALFKKAELSIDGIAHLNNEAVLLDDEWALSVARGNFAALQSLIAQAKGVAALLHKTFGADLDGDNSTQERLTQKELFKVATEYKELIAEHEHEAALREYERSLDKPKGKGRPKAAPTKD